MTISSRSYRDPQLVPFNGKVLLVKEWLKELSISKTTYYRYRKFSNSPAEALQKALDAKTGASRNVYPHAFTASQALTLSDRTLRLSTWCEYYKVPVRMYQLRIRAGMTPYEALTFRKEWATEPLNGGMTVPHASGGEITLSHPYPNPSP